MLFFSRATVDARNYIKSAPLGWIKVILRSRATTNVVAKLANTAEVKKLGPTIAKVLKREYGYDDATYYETVNYIVARSRNY